MSRLNDKQVLIATIAVPLLCTAGFGYLIWRDLDAVHRNEITEDNPAAAEVSDPEEWGEHRKKQEAQRQIDQLRGEADLIDRREKDVIVYREIVKRDAQILPDTDLVNRLADTIDEFQRQSGVQLTRVGDLKPGKSTGAIASMPIKLSVQGTFDQFLRFLNMFESMDRIVNVKSFQVAAGPPSKDGEPPMHNIALELETFVYNGSAGLAKPVEIQNYDRRKDDPVIQKLIKQAKPARIEKYALKPRINRRDPLVDPRRSENTVDVQVTPEEEAIQKAMLDRLKVEVELLAEDLRQLEQYITEKKYVVVVQLRALIEDKLGSLDLSIRDADKKLTIPSLRESFQDEVLSVFTKVKEQAPQADRVKIVTRPACIPVLESMRQAHERKDFEFVVRTMKDFEEWLREKQIVDDAAELVTGMRDLAREAQVLMEFEKLEIRVQGRIRRPEGTVVLLNGKARKVGDFIDEAQRIKLAGVRDDALVFEFDGFEITRATGGK